VFVSLLGNGTTGLYVCSADLFFPSNLEMDGFELDDEDVSFELGFGCADIGGLNIGRLKTGALKTWLSTCF